MRFKITKHPISGAKLCRVIGKDGFSFTLETNGNLPQTHSRGIGHWTEEEVRNYVSACGTDRQRRLIGEVLPPLCPVPVCDQMLIMSEMDGMDLLYVTIYKGRLSPIHRRARTMLQTGNPNILYREGIELAAGGKCEAPVTVAHVQSGSLITMSRKIEPVTTTSTQIESIHCVQCGCPSEYRLCNACRGS